MGEEILLKKMFLDYKNLSEERFLKKYGGLISSNSINDHINCLEAYNALVFCKRFNIQDKINFNEFKELYDVIEEIFPINNLFRIYRLRVKGKSYKQKARKHKFS
jgi:hypothetical protein